MTYALYDATVGMAKCALASLERMLTEAEKHPGSATFFTARLTDDMKPLTFQVHYATSQAQTMAAKLCGQEYTEPEENLDSYDKMRNVIHEAMRALDKTERNVVNARGESMTAFSLRGEDREFPVHAVVGLWNMPNIYFHVAMAYAILRKEGVPLGKRDWSRAFASMYV